MVKVVGGGSPAPGQEEETGELGVLDIGAVLEDCERGKPTGTCLASSMPDSFFFLLQSCDWQETPNFAASDASLVISSPERREIDI